MQIQYDRSAHSVHLKERETMHYLQEKLAVGSIIKRAIAVGLMCAAVGGVAAQNADKQPDTNGPSGNGVNNPLIMAMAWKQTAAEYKALYHQAFNIARMQVERALATKKPGDKPLAIVTDMDDTIIQAANYWGYLINNNKDFFDDPIWDEWIPENLVTPAPGALEFLNFCKANNVEVFYVTSREQGPRTFEYAMGHLKVNGFPYADEKHLTVLRDTSNKEKRQIEIGQNYDIVVFLGDNLNDFRRIYYVKDIDERARLMEQDKHLFGQKFIILPNPTDGHWIRAIFGDSEPPATDANREILKKAATRSHWNRLK